MKFTDYYRVLGVAPEADADTIKTAYRKLARTLHPDVNKQPGAEKRFIELGEAHEALQDPERRAAYDRLRAGGWRDGQEIETPQPAFAHQHGARNQPGDADQFSEFFQSLFGRAMPGEGRRGYARRMRGEDLHYTMPVSLEESYHGGQREFSFQDGGRTISVTIAKGVVQGTRMRLRGQGRPGSDAEDGDLYLEVVLAPHRLYRVEGRDLTMDLPIAPWEAVLGAEVAVPTLGGTITVTIPAGSHSGQKLRLKGRGLPGDQPGDQYVILDIVVPPTVDERTRQLYRDLAKGSAFDPRAGLAA